MLNSGFQISKAASSAVIIAFLIILKLPFLLSCESDSMLTDLNDFEEEEIQFTNYTLSCTNFYFAAANESLSEFLIIDGDLEEQLPDTLTYIFDLSGPESPEVYVESYPFEDGSEYAGCFPYCNDAICGDFDYTADRWEAISGEIELERSEIEVVNEQINWLNYTIKIEIKNAVFEYNGQQLEIELLKFEEISMGRPIG